MYLKNEKNLALLSGGLFTLIFGFSFMFSKVALGLMTPIEMISYRFLLAALVLYGAKLLKLIKIDLKGKNIRIILLLSLAEPVVYFIFESLGLNLTSSFEAGLMISLIPVITAVFSIIFLNERLRPIQVFFMLMSLGGVLFINLMKEKISLSGNILGIIFLLIAVSASGFYNIGSKKASTSFTPVEITYVMMWVGAISFNSILIINNLIKGTMVTYFAPLISWQAVIPILYLGILSSIVAFFLVNYSIAKMKVSQFSVLSNITTMVSIFAGIFILKESFLWYHIVGSILILLGVWGTVYFGEKDELPLINDI